MLGPSGMFKALQNKTFENKAQITLHHKHDFPGYLTSANARPTGDKARAGALVITLPGAEGGWEFKFQF